jgi:hypothetical protein
MFVMRCAGQGSKICPFIDEDEARKPHTTANRGSIEERLRTDREYRLEISSPTRDIFQKTAAYLTAIRRSGCRGPLYEPTSFNDSETQRREMEAEHSMRLQRGYLSSERLCEGRLMFEYNFSGKAYLK